MLWKITTGMDTRQDANAIQPEIFGGQPTTDFFGTQDILISREMTLTEQESPSFEVPRGKTSDDILDEVFKDYEEAWKRLADL